MLLKWLAIVLLLVVAAAGTAVAAARALLPATCEVAEERYNRLVMEMSYAKAKELLGCDGVLVAREAYGQIVIEYYAWRGAAWPYGRLRLQFINDTLQGTEKLWLNLSVGRTS